MGSTDSGATAHKKRPERLLALLVDGPIEFYDDTGTNVLTLGTSTSGQVTITAGYLPQRSAANLASAAGKAGEVGYCTTAGKWYGCTAGGAAGSATWELITSS